MTREHFCTNCRGGSLSAMDENDDPLVQVSDDGSVAVLTVSEQRVLQGRSIPDSSICGSELGAPSSSTGPRCIIGCGAPPPPPTPHVLFCARRRAAAAAAAAAADEGDDDDKNSDARLALATRAVYTRHRHDLMLTAQSRCVIKTTTALIKREEAEAEAARGHHAGDKPTPDLANRAREGFVVRVATGLSVPRDGVRVTGAPAPAMIDSSPLRATFHKDDDNRRPEEEIEGRDGGLWDCADDDDDGELDDKIRRQCDRTRAWRHGARVWHRGTAAGKVSLLLHHCFVLAWLPTTLPTPPPTSLPSPPPSALPSTLPTLLPTPLRTERSSSAVATPKGGPPSTAPPSASSDRQLSGSSAPRPRPGIAFARA